MSLSEPAIMKDAIKGIVPPFDRSRLSERENEILDLAADGLTDVQIGLKLSIRPSTVNSYWVRIRGKVGHLSRTEMVALSLKHEARTHFETLLRKSQELEAAVLSHAAQASGDVYSSFYRAAIDALPEALLVLDKPGNIIVSNARAESLFDYPPGALLGLPIDALIPEKYRNGKQLSIRGDDATAQPRNLGVHSLIYARERTGREFRVILLFDTVHTPDGLVTSCIVRPFLEEINSMRLRAADMVNQL